MLPLPNNEVLHARLTRTDLEEFARRGPAFASLAAKSQGWLTFWNNEVGLPGFYPFDLVAAGYLAHPALFDCAQTDAGIAREWTFWLIPHQSLLVPAPDATALTDVIYCPQVSMPIHDFLVSGA